MMQKEMTMLNVPLDCLQGATLTGVRLPRAVKTAGHPKLGCVCVTVTVTFYHLALLFG